MKKSFKSVLALIFVVLTMFFTMSVASAVSAPTLKVKSVATTSVTLYWTKVSDADGYQIQRTTDGKTWTTLSSSVTATEYTDSKSLTTGKSYGYRIRSYDKKLLTTDYSSWTAMVTAKPLPAKVTGLKVKAANASAIQLTWDKVAGASGYTVQFLSGSTWKTYKTLAANTITVTGCKLGTTYSFRVAALKVVSGKYVYGAVSATLKASPILPATSTVKLAGVNANAVKLVWAGVSGAKGFEVYNHKTGKWINAGATTTTIISGFQPGEKCDFTVRAYAGSVKGKESKVYSFKTVSAVPTNIVVKDSTPNSITFSWDPVEGADGYQPAYYDYAAKKWVGLALTQGTSATATGLKGSTVYAIRVRSYITNTNVHNISATVASAWPAYINTKTALPAPTVTANKGPSSSETSISWSSLTAATGGYSIERYNSSSRTWDVYDFSKNSFRSYAAITSDSIITTTALSFVDKGAENRGDVYRVRAYDAEGNKGAASANVTAFTSTIAMNTTAGSFSIQQTIAWPAASGAKQYKIITKNPVSSLEDVAIFDAAKITKNGTCQANIYMAPNSIHSIMIFTIDENGNATNVATDWVTFSIGAVPIVANNHALYDYTVNSQLLYLAQAINNTKVYTDPITVTNKSQVSYDVNYLKFLAFEYDTPEEVQKFFERFGGDEDMTTSASETFDATYHFDNGSAITEEGKTIKLKSFVEPSSGSTTPAYLYDSQNYTAWKNGFSSVTTKKNADGSLTMTLKFKQEKTNSPYHNGYMSAFSASDFAGAGSGLTVSELSVGASTLTVVIDKDGILKSYNATSPYSARFAASFTTDEGSSDLGVNSGDLISMKMGIAGKTIFNYTFVK